MTKSERKLEIETSEAQLKNVKAALNGEIVNGVKLGDAGVTVEWLTGWEKFLTEYLDELKV